MRKKNLSQEERELFRQSVGKVRPVKSDTVLLKKPRNPVAAPRLRHDTDTEQALDASIFVDETLSLEDTLYFIGSGLQKNVLKKLRRGYYGLDAEIDLHGLNSHEAKHQLLLFLRDCVEDGCRCVCIVHGKGYRSQEGLPVLKNNLNLWLRQHRDVQAFCSTPPKKGGAGAVWVLLRLSDKYSDDSEKYS
ncbi:MAG: DNA mismatch repair protein MutS [Gammaproteobacteria bacterium HGW-Gammaproteobacteria-3]|nr:MAG: DNA mismatch repair protein MutS [Gammaproteobacteria bacterium HGW-Gammaproteobacteria-3]